MHPRSRACRCNRQWLDFSGDCFSFSSFFLVVFFFLWSSDALLRHRQAEIWSTELQLIKKLNGSDDRTPLLARLFRDSYYDFFLFYFFF